MKNHFSILGGCFLYIFIATSFCACKYAGFPQNGIDQDTLSARIRSLMAQSRWEDAVKLNGEYIKNANLNHDHHGIVLGYVNIGNIYGMHNDYQEALLFLNKANREKGQLNDPELDARLSTEYAIIYNALGLKDKATEYHNRAFEAVQKIRNSKRQIKALWYLYAIKAAYYEDKQQFDSLYVYLCKASDLQPEPNLYCRMAKYFIARHVNTDSARFYLQAADSLYNKGLGFPLYYKALIYRTYGDLYTFKNEYDQAIASYMNAIGMFQKEQRIASLPKCYNLLSQVYGKKGDAEKSHEYLEKYTTLSDSLAFAKEAPLAISVKNIEDEYEQQYSNGKRKLLRLSVGLLSLIILVALLVLRKAKKRKQVAYKLLVQKDELLAQKEEETSLLQKKVDGAVDELIELAKQNDSHFYIRFQDMHPEWHKKMMEIAPDISFAELTLCAYIYLDFQTKDIAEYTCKSIRTIQNGKYSIRKKLKPGNVDLHIWLKALG
ncbi:MULTISPECIES: hypothetical protein [Chitinophagaceae]